MLWLDGPLMEDALAMSSQLTEILRDTLKEVQQDQLDSSSSEDGHTRSNWTQSSDENMGDEEDRYDGEDDERVEKRYGDTGRELAWKRWGRCEEQLRTLYSAYFVLNILAICFGVPHPLSSTELDLVLPSSEAEFAAPTWIAWLRLRRRKMKASQKQPTAQWQERGIPASKPDEQRPRFLTCLHQLLAGQRLTKDVAAREYGNYMLVQTLVIHINRERQAIAERPASYSAAPSSSPSPQAKPQPPYAALPPDIVSLYARALNAWQAGWDSAIDASPLDPNAQCYGSHTYSL
ncbi:c2h2 type zinc finger containing protein [Ophiostoma piceae UAMH 11346]|uniref:C2h2 type zinc finger containing protein n=1 Tax=Ophiostoma piceae (strain UAMH 11346) TaxID=1262450 RepID=S3BS29_OPHP1|nr:c2h2 type zinc finger containing protein [Ophiostoma piceae UAMH 11346]